MIENKTNDLNKISYESYCKKLQQRGKVIWVFGLSGSGKSTIGKRLEEVLTLERKVLVYSLDGDSLRLGLNKDLGFSDANRTENIRRAAEVAKMMANAGLIVIVTMITPLESMRKLARDIIGKDKYIEVYLKTPLEICENRDPKGLYAKVRQGQIKQFTGIDSPFEEGSNSDLVIDTESLSIEESVEKIWNFIKKEISY